MKKTHIILIVAIIVAISVILSTSFDAGTYANFSEASSNPKKKYHVVGKLNKEKDIDYSPEDNILTFYMLDNDGEERRVFLNKPKPMDFERSESIVLIGQCKQDAFYASEILMKCPSKYNEQNQIKDNT